MNIDKDKLRTRFYLIDARCYNRNDKSYKNYGLRGIYVVDDWHIFENFYQWFIGQPNADISLQVDRINNDGPYSPDNCRLVTIKENLRNSRKNVLLTAWGITQPAISWSEDPRCVISVELIRHRLEAGWIDPIKILTTPVSKPSERLFSAFGEEKTLIDWSVDIRCVVEKHIAMARVNRHGWSFEKALATPLNVTRFEGLKNAEKMRTAWGETKPITQWLEDPRTQCFHRPTILSRLKNGWTVERALSQPVIKKK